jgi:hypothetical protein
VAVDLKAGDEERRGILHALRERLLERNYIHNLLAGIERELGGHEDDKQAKETEGQRRRG